MSTNLDNWLKARNIIKELDESILLQHLKTICISFGGIKNLLLNYALNKKIHISNNTINTLYNIQNLESNNEIKPKLDNMQFFNNK